MDKILIIDDEVLVIETLKDALSLLPFEVLVSQDPIEGFKVFHDKRPFLLILDINMQPLNGLEFIKRLIKEEVPNRKYNHSRAALPIDTDSVDKTLKEADFYVLVLTGYGSQDLMKQCRTLGVEFFLNKPIHINILRNIICNIHALKQNRDELNKSAIS